MMTNLIFTAIGKFLPDEPIEGISKPIDSGDFLFRCAIVPSEVMIYEEWFANPDFPYYHHKGPFLTVKLKSCTERTLICTFEEFHLKYQAAMSAITLTKLN